MHYDYEEPLSEVSIGRGVFSGVDYRQIIKILCATTTSISPPWETQRPEKSKL